MFLSGLATALAAGAQASNPDLLYVLPMRGGFDQFLSNHIATAKLFRVVTDPRTAGVFLADRIGEPFERKMAELNSQRQDEDKKKSDSRTGGSQKEHEFPTASFSSGAAKGNVFLVDARSRQVIWSGYVKPKNSTADELNRTARKVAELMAAELRASKTP